MVTTVQTAPKARTHKMAASAKAAAAGPKGSVLAGLESRATTQSATAPASAALRTGNNFTGQYLYDRFVNPFPEDVSKMNIVREMVSALDTQSFSSVVGDMVKIAKEQADQNKGNNFEAYYDARLKTARNHQSVMRNAYGALKYFPEAMAESGVDEQTGYHVINTIAKAVLTAKGVKWDGTKLLNQQERQIQQHTKQEAKLMAEVMQAHPKKSDETREAYYSRIDKLVAKAEKELAEETKAERLESLAAKIKEMAGTDLADLLALLK